MVLTQKFPNNEQNFTCRGKFSTRKTNLIRSEDKRARSLSREKWQPINYLFLTAKRLLIFHVDRGWDEKVFRRYSLYLCGRLTNTREIKSIWNISLSDEATRRFVSELKFAKTCVYNHRLSEQRSSIASNPDFVWLQQKNQFKLRSKP